MSADIRLLRRAQSLLINGIALAVSQDPQGEDLFCVVCLDDKAHIIRLFDDGQANGYVLPALYIIDRLDNFFKVRPVPADSAGIRLVSRPRSVGKALSMWRTHVLPCLDIRRLT